MATAAVTERIVSSIDEATERERLAAAIKAMPSESRTLLLIDVVEDTSALGQVRNQLAEVERELQVARDTDQGKEDALSELRTQLAEANRKLEAVRQRLHPDVGEYLVDCAARVRQQYELRGEKLAAAEASNNSLHDALDLAAERHNRELVELAAKLDAAERDAGRMHYLGNLVRSRTSDEQAELNELMRKYPPRPEPVATPTGNPHAGSPLSSAFTPEEWAEVQAGVAAPVEQPQPPGGLGPVDAFRAELVEALREADMWTNEQGFRRVADRLETKR